MIAWGGDVGLLIYDSVRCVRGLRQKGRRYIGFPRFIPVALKFPYPSMWVTTRKQVVFVGKAWDGRSESQALRWGPHNYSRLAGTCSYQQLSSKA